MSIPAILGALRITRDIAAPCTSDFFDPQKRVAIVRFTDGQNNKEDCEEERDHSDGQPEERRGRQPVEHLFGERTAEGDVDD